MSKAVILQHVAHEGPGRLAPKLNDYGLGVDVRRLYKGDLVPRTLDGVRLLVVMGGPMGVSDVGGQQYPFLKDEVELLRQAIALDHPVVGICLGAQLLAYAAGAKVQPNVVPGPEIGWGPVTFPFPGGTDPIVAGLHDGAMMFHWHFDTFDLPKLPPAGGQAAGGAPAVGCLLLSSTSKCRNQAFRFKGRLLGFQYHFEMDRQGIQAMLVHARADVDKVLGPGGVDAIQRDTDRYYDDYERLGNRVIDNVLQYMKLI